MTTPPCSDNDDGYDTAGSSGWISGGNRKKNKNKNKDYKNGFSKNSDKHANRNNNKHALVAAGTPFLIGKDEVLTSGGPTKVALHAVSFDGIYGDQSEHICIIP